MSSQNACIRYQAEFLLRIYIEHTDTIRRANISFPVTYKLTNDEEWSQFEVLSEIHKMPDVTRCYFDTFTTIRSLAIRKSPFGYISKEDQHKLVHAMFWNTSSRTVSSASPSSSSQEDNSSELSTCSVIVKDSAASSSVQESSDNDEEVGNHGQEPVVLGKRKRGDRSSSSYLMERLATAAARLSEEEMEEEEEENDDTRNMRKRPATERTRLVYETESEDEDEDEDEGEEWYNEDEEEVKSNFLNRTSKYDNDTCYSCHKRGFLIGCDKCYRWFHTECIEDNFEYAKDRSWQCYFCDSSKTTPSRRMNE